MTSACIRRRSADRLAALLLLLACTGLQALESDRDQPMEISARSSDADLASGVYTLSGGVEIRQGSLHIQSAEAEVHQPEQDAEVTRVILTGNPARMEQALDNAAGTMRASAARIDYDRRSDAVVLTGNVRIEEPRGTLTGQRVTYDIARGRVQGQAGSGDGERVRFVIPPRPRAAGQPDGD
ncbi:MAG: lipopolysaccharide transport periplasmic protein LptA [Xanthomonadales bacterium]|nr:lipopolysaccharide transport periplasmic protein LptA [Xanthomonadales bacterium]